MKIYIRIDESGQLQLRALSVDEAIILLEAAAAREERLVGRAPAKLTAALQELLSDGTTLAGALRQHLPPPDEAATAVTPEPPEELLELAPREVLTDRTQLNHLIDGLVGRFEGQLNSLAGGFDQDPETAPARRLHGQMFRGGKVFLTFAGSKQWLAVRERFADLDETARSDVDSVRLTRDLGRIVAMNDYYGRLLGITEDSGGAPASDGDEDALERDAQTLERWLIRAVGLANAAWPGEGQEDASSRRVLLEYYLDPIFDAARERARRARDTSETSDGETPSDDLPAE